MSACRALIRREVAEAAGIQREAAARAAQLQPGQAAAPVVGFASRPPIQPNRGGDAP